MALYELVLPKMGESVAEATIIKWVKQPGDLIEIDESVLEIATDKVDSEVPSPVAGKLVKILFNEEDVVQVGAVIAVIETDADSKVEISSVQPQEVKAEQAVKVEPVQTTVVPEVKEEISQEKLKPVDFSNSERFYSPLVKSMAAEEGISLSELNSITGTGSEGRVTKQDILDYIKINKTQVLQAAPIQTIVSEPVQTIVSKPSAPITSVSGGDEIIEMDRMRKLIADHMVMSKSTSAHVTSFVEADVTNMVKWRERVKSSFEKREGEKITFTPIFIEAVAKAIKDLPMINISVNGTQIIKKRDINIGMAAALPSGNLIVPVIKNADQLNLLGITKAVNDLASRARQSKLKPDETQGGTFTLTNVGTFGNVMGTPIINQPQVAVLAVGAIKKKPAVIETEYGDVIAIRHMMFLSLSYDHRVVDGSLGGSFVRRVADYLEAWDLNREI
ncbi:2-oxoglutarate dehydrogenase E2 component (dihydrolipoamide succinyltransferase) [Daejeonella rubra]|uniref:Dihydrolipoamide acetyltransferase component of pyruvate dehydrogenase complex n=1 Tax=Daejeonella rubra TaxID=990371 RepID=A0A1G9W234_9SPHI|nr:dihydrolipoamide acetyltransferase family protein [Daejeonella rubra]SDM78251.1 2-oxoglutarate dehydrogenase E2 component (dihydrolipoamide succinyltransferase) [Daejeonella rubra]